MRTNIVVTFQIEALHQWKNAKDVVPQVGFLSDLHHHLFHIKAEKATAHDDNERPIEIIMFKRLMEQYLKDKYFSVEDNCCNLGNMSCELLAKELVEKFNLASCEVLEDGRWGAVVYA